MLELKLENTNRLPNGKKGWMCKHKESNQRRYVDNMERLQHGAGSTYYVYV